MVVIVVVVVMIVVMVVMVVSVELTRSLTLLLKFIVQREVVALSRKHKTC